MGVTPHPKFSNPLTEEGVLLLPHSRWRHGAGIGDRCRRSWQETLPGSGGVGQEPELGEGRTPVLPPSPRACYSLGFSLRAYLLHFLFHPNRLLPLRSSLPLLSSTAPPLLLPAGVQGQCL